MSAERRTAYWVGAIALLIAALFVLRDILLPFVVGIAIAYLLDPVADRLERWGLPRWAAAAVITLASVVAVIAVLLLLVPLLQTQLLDLVERVPRYVQLAHARAIALLELLRARLSPADIEALRSQLGALAGPDAIAWAGRVLGRLWGGGVAIFNLVSLLVITPVITFYLLRDWDRIVAMIDGWLPPRHAETVREQVRTIDRVLAGFVRGQLIVCLLLAVFYAAGLTLVGLDFGLVIGVATGLISFVPYFGMLIGFAVGTGVAAAQFGAWGPVLMVAGVFVAGQFLEGNFITPRLVGSRVGLHPAWMIFALLAGGSLAGFTGILLAVPAAAVIGVLTRFAIRRYKESAAYRGDGGADGGAAGPR